ncbi:Hypothetical protein RMHFA_05614 (plasmid) [Roseomonas mucosa]|nr:Hypothetical protein RMHFA_05614 [Roseomonas mucosa]
MLKPYGAVRGWDGFRRGPGGGDEADVKVGGAGGTGGAGSGPSGAAGVRQPVLAQGLHPAAALRAAGAPAVPAGGLPGRDGPGRRVVGVATHPRTGQGAALFDPGPRLAPHPGRRRGRGAFIGVQTAMVRRARAAA